MDEYKIVYKGFESIVLPYEEVLDHLTSRLKMTKAKAGVLIRGPKITLKVVYQEEDALKFQSLFHNLGLDTDIVMPIALEPLAESAPDYNDEPSLDQQTAESPTSIAAPAKTSLGKYIKKSVFENPHVTLSNIVLFFGVLLVAMYFPFIDGVVRYGFAMGIVLMASSLSLKSVDR